MKFIFAILLMTGTAMAETETIKCNKGKTTNWYSFEAPPIPDEDYLNDGDARETNCVQTTRFHGDGRIGIAAFSKGPEQRNPSECWKEIARTQIDGAKCCFESTEGTLTRPWQVCGVIGIPEKEKTAKRNFIRQISAKM